jgi:K+ transporter
MFPLSDSKKGDLLAFLSTQWHKGTEVQQMFPPVENSSNLLYYLASILSMNGKKLNQQLAFNTAWKLYTAVPGTLVIFTCISFNLLPKNEKCPTVSHVPFIAAFFKVNLVVLIISEIDGASSGQGHA